MGFPRSLWWLNRRLVLASAQQAVAVLPEDQRTILLLVCVEGLSYKDAAAALDIPMGTLTSRLARGRETLQALLGDGGAA